MQKDEEPVPIACAMQKKPPIANQPKAASKKPGDLAALMTDLRHLIQSAHVASPQWWTRSR